MMLWVSTAVLGLIWFLAVNALMSMVVWLIARLIERRADVPAAGVLFAIRVLPATASLLFVGFVFLPGHWRFEPTAVEESFGVALWGVASGAAAVLVRSGYRALALGLANCRLHSALRAQHATGPDEVVTVPGFPGMSLAGVFRTRILIGEAVRQTLTAPELDVAVRHELAHRSARDNVKRAAVRCSPDLFGWSRACRSLEARWNGAVECAADARAVSGSEVRALHLASALIKVARITDRQPRAPMAPLWSSLHEPALLQTRIRDLINGTTNARRASTLGARFGLIALVVVSAAACALGAPEGIHRVTEAMINVLP